MLKCILRSPLDKIFFVFASLVEIINGLTEQNFSLCVRALLAVGIKVTLLAFFGVYGRMLYFFTTAKWIL